VQHHAADQLHVVVAHAQHAAAGLAADREGFGQDLVEGFPAGDALLELRRLRLQLLVGQLLQLRLQRVDLVDDALQLLEQTLVATAEDTGKQFVDHVGNRMGKERRGPAVSRAENETGRKAPCLATPYCSLGRRPGNQGGPSDRLRLGWFPDAGTGVEPARRHMADTASPGLESSGAGSPLRQIAVSRA